MVGCVKVAKAPTNEQKHNVRRAPDICVTHAEAHTQEGHPACKLLLRHPFNGLFL